MSDPTNNTTENGWLFLKHYFKNDFAKDSTLKVYTPPPNNNNTDTGDANI